MRGFRRVDILRALKKWVLKVLTIEAQGIKVSTLSILGSFAFFLFLFFNCPPSTLAFLCINTYLPRMQHRTHVPPLCGILSLCTTPRPQHGLLGCGVSLLSPRTIQAERGTSAPDTTRTPHVCVCNNKYVRNESSFSTPPPSPPSLSPFPLTSLQP